MEFFHYYFFDIMSFNEKLKDIPIKEVLVVIILAYFVIFPLKFLNISAGMGLTNLIIILYFIFKLRNYTSEFRVEISDIFSKISFKHILLIVLANVCFSYGMLYLSNVIIHVIPANSFLSFLVPLKSIHWKFVGILSFISIILVSPIAEELIFRGIFLNKLRLIVPTAFAILISSLLFASLHSFGSIFSAFIFAVCMAILYLKSENILVPILGHFLNNFIGESVYHIDHAKVLFTNSTVMIAMSILAIVSFIFILKFINSSMKNI